MNYELVLKLRNAGFPQKGKGDLYFNGGMVIAYIPTLSELIEACGDNIDSIRKTTMQGKGENEIISCWEIRQSVDVGERPIMIWEENLEEAVANLWLELNKNENNL